MLYEQKWIPDVVNWANPCTLSFDEFDRALGATPMQAQEATDYVFCIWKYVPPLDALRFIDPLFDPEYHQRKSIQFLTEAVRNGTPIAPAQVWVHPSEVKNFPKDGWDSPRRDLLRKLQAKKPDLTYDDVPGKYIDLIVKQHEGRHRLYVAGALGEKIVPIQVWVRYRDVKW